MHIHNRFIRFLQSKRFKQITFFMAIAALFLAGVAAVKPGPFVRLGYPGIFVFTALGGSSLIVFSLANYFNIAGLAFFAASGMALNDSIAWVIGSSGKAVIEKPKKLKKIEKSVQKYGSYAIFFWSIIPFPYDLVGFVAGYLNMNYFPYVVPTFLGKFIRFLLIGYGMVTVF